MDQLQRYLISHHQSIHNLLAGKPDHQHGHTFCLQKSCSKQAANDVNITPRALSRSRPSTLRSAKQAPCGCVRLLLSVQQLHVNQHFTFTDHHLIYSFVFVVLGREPRAVCTRGKCPTTELYSQPHRSVLVKCNLFTCVRLALPVPFLRPGGLLREKGREKRSCAVLPSILSTDH